MPEHLPGNPFASATATATKPSPAAPKHKPGNPFAPAEPDLFPSLTEPAPAAKSSAITGWDPLWLSRKMAEAAPEFVRGAASGATTMASRVAAGVVRGASRLTPVTALDPSDPMREDALPRAMDVRAKAGEDVAGNIRKLGTKVAAKITPTAPTTTTGKVARVAGEVTGQLAPFVAAGPLGLAAGTGLNVAAEVGATPEESLLGMFSKEQAKSPLKRGAAALAGDVAVALPLHYGAEALKNYIRGKNAVSPEELARIGEAIPGAAPAPESPSLPPSASPEPVSRTGAIGNQPPPRLPLTPGKRGPVVDLANYPLSESPAGRSRAVPAARYQRTTKGGRGGIEDRSWMDTSPLKDESHLTDRVLGGQQRRLLDLAHEVGDAAPAGAIVIDPGHKPAKSVANKIARKELAGERPDLPPLQQIGDINRASLVVEHPNDAGPVIAKLQESGWLKELDDKFAKPDALGYGAIHAQLQDPITGQVAELQIHTPQTWSARADLGGHDIYDYLFSKEAKPIVSAADHREARRLIEYNRKLYSDAHEAAMTGKPLPGADSQFKLSMELDHSKPDYGRWYVVNKATGERVGDADNPFKARTMMGELDRKAVPTEAASAIAAPMTEPTPAELPSAPADVLRGNPFRQPEAPVEQRMVGGNRRGSVAGPASNDPYNYAALKMLSSIAGAGGGSVAGATAGGKFPANTPEERKRNRIVGAGLGGIAGALTPFSPEIAERAMELASSLRSAGATEPARVFQLHATPEIVRLKVAGKPSQAQMEQLFTAVRDNPNATFRYSVRDLSGREVGSGRHLHELAAEMPWADSNRPLPGRTAATVPELGRTGAIGNQPERTPATRAIPEAEAKVHEPIAPEEVDDFVNAAKFSVDPTGEKRLRETVQQVVEQYGLAPKERITWNQTREAARQIGLDQISQADVHRLSGAEMLAVRNIVSANVDELGKAYELRARLLQTGAGTKEEARRLSQLEATIGGLEAQNNQLLGRFIKARSSTGRDLNNLKIIANRTLDPVVWLSKAKKLMGDIPMTEAQKTKITKFLNDGDRAGLVTYMMTLRKALTWTDPEFWTTLRKAGLLTNFKTQARNFLSNAPFGVMEIAKDAPATVADALASTLTNTRTKNFDLGAAVAASWKGAKQGAAESRSVMRSGAALPDVLAGRDIPFETNFKNPILDRYTKFVFRSMSAADRPFKQAAMTRSIAEQARVMAKAEGLKGAEFEARVRQFTDNPTNDMATRAVIDAEHATFQNKSVAGEIALGAKARAKRFSPVAGAAVDLVVPFVKTPGAVAGKVLEYSPLGALGTAYDIGRLLKATQSGADRRALYDLQKRLAERFGRWSTGTFALAAGYYLASKGIASGPRPPSSTETTQANTEGKLYDAVKLNGRWWSLTGISPLGNLMAIGSQLWHNFDNPELSSGEAATATGAGILKTLKDQPFLTGTQSAIDAITDPVGKASKFATDMAGSFIPGAAAATARGVDPTPRATSSIADAVKARVPGLSQTLPAQVGPLGPEPAREDSRTVAFLQAMVDPFSSRKDRTIDDATIAEMAAVGAKVGRVKKEKGEDAQTYHDRALQYAADTRKAIEEVIASPDYAGAEADAEWLVDHEPKYQGKDVRDVTRILKRELIQNAAHAARTGLTADRAAENQ